MNILDYVTFLFYLLTGIGMVLCSRPIILVLQQSDYSSRELTKRLLIGYKTFYDLPLTYSLLFFIAVIAINIIFDVHSALNIIIHWALICIYFALLLVYRNMLRPAENKHPEYTPRVKRLYKMLVLFYLFTAAEIYVVDILLLGNTFLKGFMVFIIVLLIGNGVTAANTLSKLVEWIIKKVFDKKH